MVTIRPVCEADAEALLALRHHLDQETKFMLLEPGERTATVEQTRELIRSGSDYTLVAEVEGQLVGWLGASRKPVRRVRHSVYIVVGILQAFAGQGIGTGFFAELEAWARQNAIHRLELTVMTHNAAGVALYTKMGFEIEGIKRHSLLIDGAWVDEYYMGRLL